MAEGQRPALPNSLFNSPLTICNINNKDYFGIDASSSKKLLKMVISNPEWQNDSLYAKFLTRNVDEEKTTSISYCTKSFSEFEG